MEYTTTRSDDHTTVFLSGEVDLDRSPDARKALLDAVAHGQTIVVDMQQVEYIDSSGVASLVEALQASRKNNLEFSLQNVSEPALKVFRLARLEKVFNII
ncbi:MAG: STAS domain-containing protein [Gammaproteobacteria bacterium]|nr:STAS domain-containing protein [Gammaproteobacteria bacterium]NVK87262.1 STAS domain-containing protein [Gammaproteobacteria bacterium]